MDVHVEAHRSTPSIAGTLHALLTLTKPRVTWLVSLSAAAGLWLAPHRLPWPRALLVFLSITALVGSANALNCYLERDVDARMRRTRSRPLPAGELSAPLAHAFGVVLGAMALALLWATSNLLTAALGLVALVGYVGVYTPMKRRSPWALLVGAVPGALPPTMGWTAASGSLDAGALLLFAMLFLWQVPHFAAIALLQQEDYARAGLRVWPVVHGDRATWKLALVGALGMIPIALGFWLAGLGGPLVAVLGGGLAAWVARRALLGLRAAPGNLRSTALGLLKSTLVQLPAMLLMLAALARG